MDFGIINIIKIIGALALFIYGMKTMSEGVQKAAGTRFRQALKSVTENRYLGFLTGLITTAGIQSSSATSVMTVSFVNAGIISLFGSVGVMIGANIGTTITAWIISSEFQISLHELSLPIIAIAVPLLFRRVGNSRFWGEFLLGLAILFLSIYFLQMSVPDIEGNPDILKWLSQYSESGFLSTLLFVVIGIILTVILQSSSASMALTLTMCIKGWLPFDLGAAMVLGSNIGTTVTAEVASLIGNIEAKRAARVHTLFNILGVVWMVLVLPIFLDGISWFTQFVLQQENPLTNPDGMNYGLSAFHTAFNIVNALILLPLVPWLIFLAKKTIPDKTIVTDEIAKLRYINSAIKSPEFSIAEARTEMVKFFELTGEMNQMFKELVNGIEKKKQKALIKKIKAREKLTDSLDQEIATYITEVSRLEMAQATSLRIRSMLKTCNDLERIGDLYLHMAKLINKKIEGRIWFTPDQRLGVNTMIDKVELAFVATKERMSSEKPKKEANNIKKIENEIDELEHELKSENIKSIHNEDSHIEGVMIFFDLISDLEKVGDYIYSINGYLSNEL